LLFLSKDWLQLRLKNSFNEELKEERKKYVRRFGGVGSGRV
jgi:hypothetical protein